MAPHWPGKLAFASTADLPAPPPAATAPAAEADADRRADLAAWLGGGRFYLTLAGIALLIAALSLLIPSTPSYDPWAWLVWGREIIHLDLHTLGGPTWKPLPGLFTVPFALLGSAQPNLWLVVARAGAIVCVVMIFRLSWRIARDLGGERIADAGALRILFYLPPLLAGAIATFSVMNSSGFVSDNALGYSEGFATALMLISVERFFDGHRRQPFVIGFFAALDRPELWLVWGPYGLWLFWKEPGARKLVAALFLLTPVLWFGAELWGSGQLLRGVSRAHHPRSNSAAFTSCPVCTVFKKEAWHALLNRVKVPAIIALLVAVAGLWRTRASWRHAATHDRVTRARAALLAIGLFGFAWWVGIALETEAGFSGNNRYLVFGTAPVAIAGGIAWGWWMYTLARAARWAGARVGAVRALGTPRRSLGVGVVAGLALFLAVPPWIGQNTIDLQRTHRALFYQALLRTDLDAAIQRAGGAQKVLSCGSVMTEGFQVPMVAWYLGVGTMRVQAPPSAPLPAHNQRPTLAEIGPAPNVILQTRETHHASLLPLPQDILAWQAAGAHYRLLVHNRVFRLFSTCG